MIIFVDVNEYHYQQNSLKHSATLHTFTGENEQNGEEEKGF